MEKEIKICLGLFACFLGLALGCDRCVYQSKLAYYSYPGAVNVGACGYGSYVSELYSGNVAAALSSVYRDGIGCGACYQIRCKNTSLCTEKGAKVVVTDRNQNSETGFVVSVDTFSSLAFPGKESMLVNQGVVDFEYARIPCNYGSETMKVKVVSFSQYPDYLAVQFLKQGGQTDIIALDTAQVGTVEWLSLKRNYGSVWDIQKPPSGDLQFRFTVTRGYDRKYVLAKGTVLPSKWKSDMVYDTGIQISDIAKEDCSPCSNIIWSP